MIDRRTAVLGMATFAVSGTAAAASKDKQVVPADANPGDSTTPQPAERVSGIGGFFFRSHEPKKLAAWYQEHLGIDPVPTDYGQKPWQQTAGPTAFSPFSMTTDYLGPPQQSWMLNFRVRNLDAMAAQLRRAGIEVAVDPEKYPNGRFARLHDPEGNPLELWEPVAAG